MNSKKCKNCGELNPKENVFCEKCGKNFEELENEIHGKVKCEKCGAENSVNAVICANCGKRIKQQIKQEKKEGNNLSILTLLCLFSGQITLPLALITEYKPVYVLCLTLPMAGIILMIYGRVKYPKNTILKITMWIVIVIALLIALFILAALVSSVDECD